MAALRDCGLVNYIDSFTLLRTGRSLFLKEEHLLSFKSEFHFWKACIIKELKFCVLNVSRFDGDEIFRCNYSLNSDFSRFWNYPTAHDWNRWDVSMYQFENEMIDLHEIPAICRSADKDAASSLPWPGTRAIHLYCIPTLLRLTCTGRTLTTSPNPRNEI